MTIADPLQLTPADVRHGTAGGLAQGAREAVPLAVLALLVTWFPHAFGGRGPGATSLACLAVASALCVSRAWRWSGAPRLALLGWLAGAGLLVLPLTSGGRDGSVAAATYGLAAVSYLLARTLARREQLATALAAAVAAGGLFQFGWAFLPWWGSGNPAHEMVGTYYWKNQFAAALLAPAVLGLALAVLDRRPWRLLGWVTAPLAVTGVFLSASRAALGVLAVGWVVTGVVLARPAEGRRSAILRWAAVSVLAGVVAFVLPGPPLFAEQRSPLSQTIATSTDGHLQSSGSYRLQVWAEAAHVFADHPVHGVGYGRVVSAIGSWKPAGWPESNLVHNGVLQAFADGGLLLGLPLLLGVLLAAVALLRRVTGVLGGGAGDQSLPAVAAIAGLLLLGHSLVDFDWSYPALAVVTAVTVGLATPASDRTGPTEDSGRARHLPMLLTAVLVAALVVGAAASWGQVFHVNAPTQSSQGATE